MESNIIHISGEVLREGKHVLSAILSYLPVAGKCISITVIVELIIALIFRIYSYKIIIIVNVATQILLHIIILTAFYTSLYYYSNAIFLSTEVVILFLEYLLYCILIKDKRKVILWFYALIANLSTFLLGLWIDV
jgi:hypothetical protein